MTLGLAWQMSEQDLHDSKINARLVGVELYFDD